MAAQKAAAAPKYRPRRNAPVVDTTTGFCGLFQAVETMGNGHKPVPTAFIRPYGGGPEIETSPDNLREPTPDEILSAKVAAANRNSREGVR